MNILEIMFNLIFLIIALSFLVWNFIYQREIRKIRAESGLILMRLPVIILQSSLILALITAFLIFFSLMGKL